MQLKVIQLGTIPYLEALSLQRAAAAARLAGTIPDVLLLCEHPPVVTLGRSTKPSNLTTTPASLAARGVEVHEVERGGDVTFHGPGQLVAYPILDLASYRKDLHWYLRQLEKTIITALSRFEIAAEQRPGLTGVWTNNRKIASIGVHARSWVTWHGFALNVTTDLSYFDLMVPCGISGVEMTSIARERPDAAVHLTPSHVAAAFAEQFGVEMMSSTPEFLFSLHG
jgi:lipoyl(octanoyl) transferase